MSQMIRNKKVKPTTIGKKSQLSLRSKAQTRRYTYHVEVVTEKGEMLSCRIVNRRGINKIDNKDGTPYTHLRITSNLGINTKINLYSPKGVVKGTIKRITAMGPSTDVEPGNIPPIKRPGGH